MEEEFDIGDEKTIDEEELFSMDLEDQIEFLFSREKELTNGDQYD